MGGVARFNRHIKLGPLGRHVEEQPAMVDFQDVGAKRSDARRYGAEHTGAIRDCQAEGNDLVSALKLTNHD
jgi:hypothetical protein